MLLILAGVSLSAVFSEKGIFNRAETAGAKYNEAKAREVLETVLLADGQYEKNINPEYNQDEFLNKLIISEIPRTEIKGDVAIISGWAFELDRTVPKIGRPLGKADKLVFPTVNATVDLATDKKNATINITAKEEKNGINKIEIWLLGEKIKEFPYDPTKTEATENYTATQNGKYTIKVYGDLWISETVEVTGIVASVTFEPNGNNEWKKEDSTKVTIQETTDKIVKSKYVWTNSINAPEDNKFIDTQTFNSGDTITGGNDTMTGSYYLWTLLETQKGEKLKWRSEGFNFDNEKPEIKELTYTPINQNTFEITVIAQDIKSGIQRYELYVDGIKKETRVLDSATRAEDSQNFVISNVTYGKHDCYVLVIDKVNNEPAKRDVKVKTLTDTTGPNITNFSSKPYSENGVTLSVTAQDVLPGITKVEFLIDNIIKKTEKIDKTTEIITINVDIFGEIEGITMGEHTATVRVYDDDENCSTHNIEVVTKQHSWSKYEIDKKEECYKMGSSQSTSPKYYNSAYYVILTEENAKFNSNEKIIIPVESSWEWKSARGNQYPHLPWEQWALVKDGSTYFLSYVNKNGNASSSGWAYEYGKFYILSATTVEERGNGLGFVSQKERNAYPDDGKASDGYWYVYEGIK